MMLNDLPPAQISENFEHFWSFVIFFGQKTGFPPQRVARRTLP